MPTPTPQPAPASLPQLLDEIERLINRDEKGEALALLARAKKLADVQVALDDFDEQPAIDLIQDLAAVGLRLQQDGAQWRLVRTPARMPGELRRLRMALRSHQATAQQILGVLRCALRAGDAGAGEDDVGFAFESAAEQLGALADRLDPDAIVREVAEREAEQARTVSRDATPSTYGVMSGDNALAANLSAETLLVQADHLLDEYPVDARVLVEVRNLLREAIDRLPDEAQS